ncbi:nitrite reductase heme biosynthesis D protein [Dinoroseobacter shibae DFL 12 = DSM 16493]|jgi:DNA-binding Lrp family transcriptional regulator|uniref:siroheme decarboxylase n=1 Tax=Dinoroseobacter shibae (strain DSM 16493 / NCIMB 14021 / DFL 12) TaxID=398580 RepID=A8LM00_DINSH|nr:MULTISPECIES: AsnC family transcriptional regulator [Dinoroseobacter]ABV94909.1 nitrite reductase heme biosynthesis D protein [Dinoroseobacter shibae DFL 12 = DSM 16493]MDD9717955.1 AsnC family transcriptional regulator [Dinoroseobacter sp. PD6]URF46330.1 AsnC family transcriptional regulator [Dinoroseobacter shibae]URF50636.1 AsnC family transcriptional regulator [Dinoroseobacter shibae]
MTLAEISLDDRLLNEFQRNVPVVARPFAEIAKSVGTTEDTVLARMQALVARGAVTRFGATCRPNTAGASTLAAVSAPEWEVEKTAAIINAQPGVNHSYLREHRWNIWFVATGPDRAHVDAALAQIGAETGLRVLDLRLVAPFNIDLGFDMSGKAAHGVEPSRVATLGAIDATDRKLMQVLSTGLPMVARPFRAVAPVCDLDEAGALRRAARLLEEGYLTRFGVIVRHRALGWRANAMVVWQVPPAQVAQAGPALAAVPGVTLCYQRKAVPGVWPYTLYNMIHGRSREDAMAVLKRARALPELRGVPHEILFSLRCFKQTGALIDLPRKEPA